MIPDSPSAILHRICLWLFLAFLCSAIIRFMLMLDLNKRVYNHTPGPCRSVPLMENGSSGMHLIKETGEVFVTFGLARSFGVQVAGGIAVYETKKDNPSHSVTSLQIVGESFHSATFSPLGLSAYHSKGRTTLYVVNTFPSRRCVEVFVHNREKHSLLHRKSICDSTLRSTNDIVVVGADRFFLSKTTYFERGWLQTAEMGIQSSFGSLLFYDGKSFSTVLSRLSSPTALAIDSTRQLLYVASLLGENVRVYLLGRDMALSFRVEISLLSSPVGLFVEEKSGDLWAALHPVVYQAYLHTYHADDNKVYSPSQILRIRMQSDGVSWVITEPYANDGATISASTSVVFHEDALFVGSMFGRMLHCDVLNPHIT